MKKPPLSLYTWNKWLALAHGLQGVAIVVAGVAKTVPVTASYLTTNTLASETAGHKVVVTASRHIFDINLAWLVAGMFFAAAIGHGIAASVYRKRQDAELSAGSNRLRWVESAISGALSVLVVAVLAGLTDVGILVTFAGVTAGAHLVGLLVEAYKLNGVRRARWLVYGLAGGAGVLPWIIIGSSLAASVCYGVGGVAWYIWAAFGVAAAGSMGIGLNLWLQYVRKGRWTEYVYGERVHGVLNIVLKTALAWIVFAGVLKP